MTTQPRCPWCSDGWKTDDPLGRSEPGDPCTRCLGSGVDQGDLVPPGFWPQIEHQLKRIASEGLDTFDAVRAVLLDPAYNSVLEEVHRNGARSFDDSAFFAGSGGDATLHQALRSAGWRVWECRTDYHYALVNEGTGEALTYTEGDIERGNRISDIAGLRPPNP